MRSRLTGKRILYMICFAFLCLIDQRIKTGSGLDGWIESFRDMTGIVVAVLILSHNRIEDYRKNKSLYLAWLAAGGILGALFIWKGQTFSYFCNDRVVMAANAWLWGVVLIHAVKDFMEKGLSPSLHKSFFCVWLVMMGLMSAFRHDIHWQLGYLLFFGCFYLTDLSKAERRELFQGMLDGVIAAFLLLQGWCMVFRPYDAVRYVGVYTNCNQNALFYLIVLAAVLTRLLGVYAEETAANGEKKEAGKAAENKVEKLSVKGGEKKRFWVKTGYWLLAGALLGFLFLTISRTGYLTAVVLIIVMFFMRWRISRGEKWLRSMLQSALTLGVCFLLTFPAVFGAVRYLPAVFHHPVWFWGEWNEEKVHSWDPWDSEKYIDLDEFLDKAASRVEDILFGDKEPDAAGGAGENSLNMADVAETAPVETAAAEGLPEATPEAGETVQGDVIAEAAPVETVPDTGSETVAEGKMEQIPEGISELQWQRYQEMLARGYGIDIHLMENGEENSLLIRSTIYRYYLNKLKLTGYPADEQGFQMLPYYWVGHAHNIYLQWGLEFGIPVMFLFVLLVVWTIGGMWKRFHAERDVEAAGGLLLFLIPCVFGLLEYCWGAGSLTLFMMFYVWGMMARKEA